MTPGGHRGGPPFAEVGLNTLPPTETQRSGGLQGSIPEVLGWFPESSGGGGGVRGVPSVA